MKYIIIPQQFLVIQIVVAKIVINVENDAAAGRTEFSFTGIEVAFATDDDINSFFTDPTLKAAVATHYGKMPKNVYYKKPTPRGDLYTRYNWEQVTKVLSVKSIALKNNKRTPVVILTQDFENESNVTIKANTGISHTVENTITTAWSKSKEMSMSQEVTYDINIILAKLSGNTGFSYTSTWGVNEERSETRTIGSTTAVETELKPGQAVTAVLSVTSGYLDFQVVYRTYLRGNLAVAFKRPHNGHSLWGPRVQDVMKSAGILNEKTVTETIRFGYNIDAKLQVINKATGLEM